MKLSASDRKALIRLASSLPKGSPERRVILAEMTMPYQMNAALPAAAKESLAALGKVAGKLRDRTEDQLDQLERDLKKVAHRHGIDWDTQNDLFGRAMSETRYGLRGLTHFLTYIK